MRLEERQQVAKREIRCDRDKAGRITEQLYYEHESAIRRLRCAVAKSRSNPPDVVMGVNAQENTSHDVSEVDKVIKMNMNLESKLKIANTARERAESRCALVVSELEAQKNDLIMLSAKLQRAEEKQANTSPCRSDALQVHLLRKSLSQRDAQLKGLRDSLVKLKADLVAVEQANAFGSPRRKDLPTYTPDGAVQDPRSKAKELAQQLNLIRSEARAATRPAE